MSKRLHDNAGIIGLHWFYSHLFYSSFFSSTYFMSIQWYPGHMHKAGKEIKNMLPQVDLVIEILDARIPFSSQNPFLAKLRGDKPCIKLLNKSDLADPALTEVWQQHFEQEHGVKTLAVSSGQIDRIRQIPELCRKLLPTKAAQERLIHALIMGIPNVGKSTLINILAGRVVAKTGNEPAITKMLQRIAIPGHIVLLDSPGMLWPKVENRNSGYRLATTGAIKDTAIAHDDIALFAGEYLLQHYPDLVKARYQLEPLPEREQPLLDAIGRKRGCLKAGDCVDGDKAAKLLLSELRAGLLGRMTFETPEMVAQELAELEKLRLEKEAQKALRKQNSKAQRSS